METKIIVEPIIKEKKPKKIRTEEQILADKERMTKVRAAKKSKKTETVTTPV